MAKNIILDALIPREDFEVEDETSGTTRNVGTIGARDLEYDSFFFSALRKPDFQRETNEWDAKRIVSLIESFISGDLIPAVILWRSAASYTFVIDGATALAHYLRGLTMTLVMVKYLKNSMMVRFLKSRLRLLKIQGRQSENKLAYTLIIN